MPGNARRELELLVESDGPISLAFWRCASDVLLWSTVAPPDRSGLFLSDGHASEVIAGALEYLPELSDAFLAFRSVTAAPELADVDTIAEACSIVCAWAEREEKNELAAQYAELAARLTATDAARSTVAGRLCRCVGDHKRSAMWFWRATRLACRKQDKIQISYAHRGYGILEHELGRYVQAEHHLKKAARAAVRVGRKSLAALAHHDLVGVTYDSGRSSEALGHLQTATAHYKPGHPRFPVLAYDTGFLWLREGYFSSALPVFDAVLPRLAGKRIRILALAAQARCAGALKDHLRFERAASEVVKLARDDAEMTAAALYLLGEGARSLADWDRAWAWARRAPQVGDRARVRCSGAAYEFLDSGAA
jgi:tetratricopeptide (TPR) repeat protein